MVDVKIITSIRVLPAEMHGVRPRMTVAVVSLLVVLATPSQSYSQILSPQCARLKDIAEANREINVPRGRTTINDKVVWCPLSIELIDNYSRMIAIYESDPQRCGVRDEIVDNLKSAEEKLAESTGEACGH
jgi:hypothetical protein